MKAKTILCLVTLGPMTTVSRQVWSWEAEVLKEKFGGQCEFKEDGEAEISKLPDVGSEFVRLEDAYGVHEETKISYVENTFGRGKAGLAELGKSIKASEVKVRKPRKKAAKKVAEKPVSKESENQDKDPLAAS